MADNIIAFPGQHRAAPIVPDMIAPIGGVDVRALHSAFAGLLLAHHAASVCQPTQQQIDDITVWGSDAIEAINQAWRDAVSRFQEQQH